MAKTTNSDTKNLQASDSDGAVDTTAASPATAPKAKKAAPRKKAAPKKASSAKKKAPAKSTASKTAASKTAAKKAVKADSAAANGETAPAPQPAPKSGIASAAASPAEPGSTRLKVDIRYSDEDLAVFKENIDSARVEAVEEFQILKEHLEDLTNAEQADENASYSMHMAEQGTEAQEKEKIYAQVQRLNDYIKKLDDAVERIENKTYGICRICGCLIAKERLLAVPITTLSASYKIRKKCPEDGVDRIIARSSQ